MSVAMLHHQHSEANTHTWRSCTNASVCVSVHTGTRCQRSCVNAWLAHSAAPVFV